MNGTIDISFRDPDAGATPWDETVSALARAELYGITTVRADGRPHVTPLIGVWHDGAMHFCTGMRVQNAHNLVHNDSVALTTGINTWAEGTRRRRRGHGGRGHRQVGPGRRVRLSVCQATRPPTRSEPRCRSRR